LPPILFVLLTKFYLSFGILPRLEIRVHGRMGNKREEAAKGATVTPCLGREI
jgi:hypothetical protein